jgi:hypothetical protein
VAIEIHHRSSVSAFNYALVGRGTLVVRLDGSKAIAGSYRTLLGQVERDAARLELSIVQGAFFFPRLATVSDPFDVVAAALSYVRRHPELKSTVNVMPEAGLGSLVIDACIKRMPGFDTRIVRSAAEATRLLRRHEPELPTEWPELALSPLASMGA